jgi:hypothetical protein
MKNTIDFYAVMKDKKPSQYHGLGKAILEKMPEHDQDAVFNFIREYSLCEVAISRGIVEVPKEIIENDDLFLFADKVNDIYSEAACGCFFCDPKIDMNAQFNDETYVCIECKRKMENVFKFCGLKK